MAHKERLIVNLFGDCPDSMPNHDGRMADDRYWTATHEECNLTYHKLLLLIVTAITGKQFNQKDISNTITSTGNKGKKLTQLIGSGNPWYFIPHPTNGKDFGTGGKGTGEFKILVVKRNNLWDIFLLHQTSTATTKAIDMSSVKKAADKIAANRQRASNTVISNDQV